MAPGELNISLRVVFYSGPLVPLCENITSSRKPDIQRTTEPWTQITCTEHFVKFEYVVSSDMRADRQTDIQTYRGRSNYILISLPMHTLTQKKFPAVTYRCRLSNALSHQTMCTSASVVLINKMSP